MPVHRKTNIQFRENVTTWRHCANNYCENWFALPTICMFVHIAIIESTKLLNIDLDIWNKSISSAKTVVK